MGKVIVGNIYPTQHSGDIVVLSIAGNNCVVRFINSGNERQALKCNIIVCKVSDKEQHRKDRIALAQKDKGDRESERAKLLCEKDAKNAEHAREKEFAAVLRETHLKERQVVRELKDREVSERRNRPTKKALRKVLKEEQKEVWRCAQRELIDKTGFYSKTLLNDIKDEDGLYIHRVSVDQIGYATRSAGTWNCIIQRTTKGGSFQKRWKLHEGVTVCDEWKNSFQSFAEWYTSQPGYHYGWDIDKDFLSDSRHYSPQTCILLPRDINLILADRCFTANLSDATKLDGIPRWRSIDGEYFTNYDLAKQHGIALKIQRVQSLRAKFQHLGVPAKVFDHIITRLSLV